MCLNLFVFMSCYGTCYFQALKIISFIADMVSIDIGRGLVKSSLKPVPEPVPEPPPERR